MNQQDQKAFDTLVKELAGYAIRRQGCQLSTEEVQLIMRALEVDIDYCNPQTANARQVRIG